MKLSPSLALSGIMLALFGSMAQATDYFVSPVAPGPVAGAPLAAISLQAQTTESRLQVNVNKRGNTAGKWVRVGEEPVAAVQDTSATTKTATSETAALPSLTTSSQQTPTNTYASFNALVQAGVLKGGDRVLLLSGYHGTLALRSLRFASQVTVASAPGHVANVEGIQMRDSANIVFRDLKVWPSGTAAPWSFLIRTDSSSSDITFANLDIRSKADSTGYLSWDLATWTNYKFSAMLLNGARMSVIGNRLTGINFGITVQGRYARVEGNIIDGFSADALRALGNDSVIRGNRVQNCFQIDNNHADGFQSWSRGVTGTPGTGTISNLTLENNKIFEWVASTSNPLACKLQGIGMFDGIYANVNIRNNLIVTSHYHGITVLGADNLTMLHNTVVQRLGTATKWPWIKVSNHKNGTPSRNVLAANNSANFVGFASDASRNISVVNNTIVTNQSSEFTAPAKLDFSLLPTAKSANAADPSVALPADILGAPRPKGTGPDNGAYESQ